MHPRGYGLRMSAPDDQLMRAEREARIAAALEADPLLAEELVVIASQLSDEAREAFRIAFADELAGHARPAAAVLSALTRASRDVPG